MKLILGISSLVCIAFGTQAHAQDFMNCDLANVGLNSLVQPLVENSVALYSGQVVLYNVDQKDSTCCSKGVAIVLPDGMGGTACYALIGFSRVDVTKSLQTYSPRRGLLVRVPIENQDEFGRMNPGVLKVRINLRDSTVFIE